MDRRLGPVGLATGGLLLASCTGDGGGAVLGGPRQADGDVAELRVEAPAPPRPPRPGETLAWPWAPLSADPELVRDGLLETYGLGFREEPAGVHTGTRWSATTGSAVRADDVVRTIALLVDDAGRLRELTCLVAGPLSPDEDMLERCVELVGVPSATRAWTAARGRRTGSELEVGEQVAGEAVVVVTTAGGRDRRVQSVQVRGTPGAG